MPKPCSPISARGFEIEILFGDGKEELGLDHYQVMSATALLRFWTLAMLAYVFLEEEQHRLQVQWQRPATIGEARREIQRRHLLIVTRRFRPLERFAVHFVEVVEDAFAGT